MSKMVVWVFRAEKNIPSLEAVPWSHWEDPAAKADEVFSDRQKKSNPELVNMRWEMLQTSIQTRVSGAFLQWQVRFEIFKL